MIQSEIKRFCEMVALYDQVGDVLIGEQNDIDKIDKLFYNEKYDAIETLYNEDGNFETADEMMEEHFGHNTQTLNVLADEFGFCRIKDR